MRFFEFLRDAFKLMFAEPKLFIPKILVAVFYSIPMLIGTYAIVANAGFLDNILKGARPNAEEMQAIFSLMLITLAVLFMMIVSFFLDIIVNAMYPLLVDDFYRKRKISLAKAFKSSLRNFFRIVPIGLGVFALVAIPLVIAGTQLTLSTSNFFQFATVILALSIAGALLITAIFYFLYPAIMLEPAPVTSCIRHNLALVRKNKGTVSGASIISVASSMLSLGLAAVSVFEPLFILAFFAERLVVTVLSTYNSILNQVIYLKVSK